MSSYCLFLMVVRYMQEQATETDIGSLLMGFLDFYGNHVRLLDGFRFCLLHLATILWLHSSPSTICLYTSVRPAIDGYFRSSRNVLPSTVPSRPKFYPEGRSDLSRRPSCRRKQCRTQHLPYQSDTASLRGSARRNGRRLGVGRRIPVA